MLPASPLAGSAISSPRLPIPLGYRAFFLPVFSIGTIICVFYIFPSLSAL